MSKRPLKINKIKVKEDLTSHEWKRYKKWQLEQKENDGAKKLRNLVRMPYQDSSEGTEENREDDSSDDDTGSGEAGSGDI